MTTLAKLSALLFYATCEKDTLSLSGCMLALTKAQGEIRYNCSHLEPGIYFYSVSCAGEVKSGKLVIVR